MKTETDVSVVHPLPAVGSHEMTDIDRCVRRIRAQAIEQFMRRMMKPLHHHSHKSR